MKVPVANRVHSGAEAVWVAAGSQVSAVRHMVALVPERFVVLRQELATAAAWY